jgi:hypothetical protein
MNDFLYIIIIIGLTIFIVFFGGHNNQNKIEYDSIYFNNLNLIINFENKINSIANNEIFKNNNFININEYLNTTHILIPNFINCFFIKINSFAAFNIFNIIDKLEINNRMMIIFNHNKSNNLELIINNLDSNLYNKKYSGELVNTGYFYDLEKNISITGVYHIYNNSNENIIITCFILKKPFWYN